MAIGLISYMDDTRPEDVTDLVTNVTYKTTPFFTMLQESVATNTYHEWLVDTFEDPADNANAEGSDATDVDLVQPTRSGNVVQLFRKVIRVSDTESAIPHYGMGDPLNYQSQKKFVELARDMEQAFVQGTRASGSSGVSRRMDGAISLITSNKTARASGTSLSEGEFRDIMAGVYDGGTDEEVTDVFVGSYLKQAIDGYTEGVTKNIEVETFRQVRRVDVYTSAFGTHAVHLSRYIPSGGVLAVDIDKWRLAWLVNRRPTLTTLAKNGSSTRLLLEGEATLESLNQQSSAYRSGYFTG